MSEKYKYEIIIYWSDEDQAFVAEVPELPGLNGGRGHILRRPLLTSK